MDAKLIYPKQINGKIAIMIEDDTEEIRLPPLKALELAEKLIGAVRKARKDWPGTPDIK